MATAKQTNIEDCDVQAPAASSQVLKRISLPGLCRSVEVALVSNELKLWQRQDLHTLVMKTGQ